MPSKLRGVGWNTTCRLGKPSFSISFPCPVPFRHSPTSCRSRREGSGKDLLEEQEYAERKRWETLSTKEKVGDWALKHQYSLILGSWAASMGVAAAIIMKDRHQTTSQKVRETVHPSAPEDFDLGLVDRSSPYVGTGIDHWRSHRCWHPDAPGSQPSRCSCMPYCLLWWGTIILTNCSTETR